MTEPTTVTGMRCDAPDAEWFTALGFTRLPPNESGNGAWGQTWGHRSGYDFTSLIFDPWRNEHRPTRWEVIIGHHASGENPRMSIGCADTLAEMQTIYEAIRAINGYPGADGA